MTAIGLSGSVQNAGDPTISVFVSYTDALSTSGPGGTTTTIQLPAYTDASTASNAFSSTYNSEISQTADQPQDLASFLKTALRGIAYLYTPTYATSSGNTIYAYGSATGLVLCGNVVAKAAIYIEGTTPYDYTDYTTKPDVQTALLAEALNLGVQAKPIVISWLQKIDQALGSNNACTSDVLSQSTTTTYSSSAQQPTYIKAYTSSDSAAPGDSITVTGYVYTKSYFLFSTGVDAKIQLVSGPISLGETATTTGGSFTITLQVSTSYFGGLITVFATPSDTSLAPSSAYLGLNVISKGQLFVSIATDKAVYGDEPVTVSGNVLFAPPDGSAKQPAANALVTVLLDGKINLGVVSADAGGHYSFGFSASSALTKLPGFPRSITIDGDHLVSVRAQQQGYTDAIGHASFLVVINDVSCTPLDLQVSGVSGSGSAVYFGSSNVPGFTQIPNLSTDTHLAEKFSVSTPADGSVAFTWSLPDGSVSVSVAVGQNSALQIGQFCQDAQGNVRVVLIGSNPGRVAVDVTKASGASTSVSIKLVTPSAVVQNHGTQYYVATDDNGSSTIATLEGTVTVSDLNDSNSVDVIAGNQLVVPYGGTPSNSSLIPNSSGASIDTSLVQLVASNSNSSSSTFSSPSNSSSAVDNTTTLFSSISSPSSPSATAFPVTYMVVPIVTVLVGAGLFVGSLMRRKNKK